MRLNGTEASCGHEGGRFKATWEGKVKIPWREAGPPNYHDDEVDSDRQVVNKELSLSLLRTRENNISLWQRKLLQDLAILEIHWNQRQVGYLVKPEAKTERQIDSRVR